MKNRFTIALLSILFMGVFLASCVNYPNEDDYVTEQLVAVTSYDTGINFKDPKYKNFMISDAVPYFDETSENPVPPFYISKNEKLQQVASEVSKNITNKLGYKETTDETQAQVYVVISLNKDQINVYGYPDYWYYYCSYFYWDCGYGPYYPYPYPAYLGSYQAGSVVIDMFDVTKGKENVKGMWTGVIRGLLTGMPNPIHSMAEVQSAIDDCFNQTVAFNK